MKRVYNALACIRPAGLKRAEWKVKRERDSRPHEIDQSILRSGDCGQTDRESTRHAGAQAGLMRIHEPLMHGPDFDSHMPTGAFSCTPIGSPPIARIMYVSLLVVVCNRFS